MYHTIVRRILRQAFANVSKGDFEVVLAQCSPTIRHWFAGDHAFGSERHDIDMVRRWFQRVAAVLPGLQLDITAMFVKGMPWDTRAIVLWTETAELPTGRAYVNHGMHSIQLRWGRVTSISVYLDTQLEAMNSFSGATFPIRTRHRPTHRFDCGTPDVRWLLHAGR
jgi:ketosteroid isomerase-like protein